MRPIVFALGILGGAIASFAQQTVVETPPEPHFVDHVVVTASLRETGRRELPGSVEVISAADLTLRQTTEIHQVLATVAGFSVAQSGSAGHTTSLFARGTGSNHTLMLWNGVPLNDPFDGRFDFAFFPTEGIERIEIVKGPYSAIYGSALGAVVNVLTSSKPGFRFDLEAGANEYRRASASGRQDFGRFAVEGSGHLRRGNGELENDDFDSDEAALRLRWAASQSLAAQVLTRFQDSHTGIPFDGATATPQRSTAFSERQIAVPVDWTGRGWLLEGLLSLNDRELAFRDPDSFFSPRSDSQARGQRTRLVVTRDRGSGWFAGGAEWNQDRIDYDDGFATIADRRREDAALFVQGHRRWGRLVVDAGVRRDENQTFGGHTSPRLGGVYERGSLRFHASYGEAFRAPNFVDLYYPFYGNPDLEPETTRSTELGASLRGDDLEVGLTAYRNRLSNLIQGAPPTFLAANVGRARTEGLEGSLRWRHGIYSIDSSLSLLDAQDSATGQALLRRPERTASFVAAASPGPLALALTAIWVGERADVDPASFARRDNPGYQRVDIATRWRARPWLVPRCRVENLTDERYEEVLGFPAPRRRLVAGLSLEF
jgi:vitamin B12 transporter